MNAGSIATFAGEEHPAKATIWQFKNVQIWKCANVQIENFPKQKQPYLSEAVNMF